MTFEELEIKLGKKLNKNEWTTHDYGGWIQNTVKHYHYCEMYDDSIAYENCELSNGNYLYDDSQVYGNAELKNNICLYGNTKIYDNADISDDIFLYNSVEIYNNVKIKGPLSIYGNIKIFGDIKINPDILKELSCYTDIFGHYTICGDFEIYDYKSLKNAIIINNIKMGI